MCFLVYIETIHLISQKPHAKRTKDPRFKGIALICNGLRFHKTENDRFRPISGGVFRTQRVK